VGECVSGLTRTVRDNPPLASAPLGPSWFLLQSLNGMERAAGLEGADFLKVFALEPEPQHGLGWGAAGPLGALELGGGPRGGCQPVERGVGQHRRLVYVGLDQLVRGLHRLAGERRRGGRVGHVGAVRRGAGIGSEVGGDRGCHGGIGTRVSQVCTTERVRSGADVRSR
jgi:hypothetical protein